MSLDYERLLIEQEADARARDDAEQVAWLRDHGTENDPLLARVFMVMAGAGFAGILVWLAYQIAGYLS